MKYINRFTESKTTPSLSRLETSKDYIEPTKTAFDEIRNILFDFEDKRIVKYSIEDCDLKFDPSGSSDVSYFIPYSILTSNPLGSVTISCHIDIDCNHNGSFLVDSLSLLEDVIVSIKRIESSGYESALNFSKSAAHGFSGKRSVIINVLVKL